VKFNSEISLGTILQVVVFLFGFMGLIYRLGVLETKLNLMWKHFEQQMLGAPTARDRKEFRDT
jgi:hypothetical protein